MKNVPESNGKVGILGISYDGFLPLMALVNPHPALKVAVPMTPMVDGGPDDHALAEIDRDVVEAEVVAVRRRHRDRRGLRFNSLGGSGMLPTSAMPG